MSSSLPPCTAHNRRGIQCERPAMDGSTVCRYHGGGVPMARAAAKKRLLAMVPDAIEALHEAMDRADWPQVVRAALGILDRAGINPKLTVEVEADAAALTKLTDAELKARTLQALAVLEQRKSLTNDDDDETSSRPSVTH